MPSPPRTARERKGYPSKTTLLQLFRAAPGEATGGCDFERSPRKEGKDGEKERQGNLGGEVDGAAAMEPHLEGGQSEGCKLPCPGYPLSTMPGNLVGEGISKNGGGA